MAAAVALQLVACSPAPRYFAVATGDGRHVVLYDGQLSLVDSIAAQPGHRRIHSLAFSSSGEVLYVADANGVGGVSMIRRYDGETIARWTLPAGHEPRALALMPSVRTILVSHYSLADSVEHGGLSFLSARDLSESARLAVCEGRPDGLAVMRTGERAFVRCDGHDATVAEVDLELRRVVRTVSLDALEGADSARRVNGCGTGNIALSRTETLLLVPCSLTGYLVYVDRLTQEPFDSVFVGPGIEGIAVSPRGPLALLTSLEPATLDFIDLRARSTVAQIPLPGPARSVAISGDGSRAIVSTGNHTTGVLLLFDLDARLLHSAVELAGAGDIGIWPGQRSPVLTW